MTHRPGRSHDRTRRISSGRIRRSAAPRCSDLGPGRLGSCDHHHAVATVYGMTGDATPRVRTSGSGSRPTAPSSGVCGSAAMASWCSRTTSSATSCRRLGHVGNDGGGRQGSAPGPTAMSAASWCRRCHGRLSGPATRTGWVDTLRSFIDLKARTRELSADRMSRTNRVVIKQSYAHRYVRGDQRDPPVTPLMGDQHAAAVLAQYLTSWSIHHGPCSAPRIRCRGLSLRPVREFDLPHLASIQPDDYEHNPRAEMLPELELSNRIAGASSTKQYWRFVRHSGHRRRGA